MAGKTPASIWSGEFRIGELVLICHILDDGSRIIEQESMINFMKWLENSDVPNQKDIEQFGGWLHGKSPDSKP